MANSAKLKLINPKYDNLREFISQIPQNFDSVGETIYQDRNVVKKIEAPDRTVLNVKRYRVPNGINKFVYSWGIRKPKGERAFLYPELLLEKNIQTPEPIAYLEERRGGLLGFTYFISLQCEFGYKMYDIGDTWEGSYEKLAKDFARFTADLHSKGFMHLDYSPGNILFDILPDGSHCFSLVDINRMYFGDVDMKKGCANFRRLWGPKKFFTAIVSEYALIRGFDPSEAVECALKYRKAFWTKYGRKHEIPFHLEL